MPEVKNMKMWLIPASIKIQILYSCKKDRISVDLLFQISRQAIELCLFEFFWENDVANLGWDSILRMARLPN